MLIGHSALRGCVMGFDNRPPTPEELSAMEKRLDEELSMGAFGMSLGLIYPQCICRNRRAGRISAHRPKA